MTRYLVVGAGPTGLTLALFLVRMGYHVDIIDKQEKRGRYSKALAIHASSLKIFKELDLLDLFMEKGNRVNHFGFYKNRRRLSTLDFSLSDDPFNFILTLPQNETEKILETALETEGVSVQRGVTLVDFKDNQKSVRVTLCNKGEEGKETYTALFACDGAHSMVREKLEIPYQSQPYPDHASLADVTMECDVPCDEGRIYYRKDGEALFVIPINSSGKYRITSNKPDVLERLPGDWIVRRVAWESEFHSDLAIVSTYQKGNIYLAGDAAHVHSPAGGMGMNTGIGDAYCLASMVKQKSLDEYSLLRLPYGKKALAVSHRLFRLIKIRNCFVTEARDFFIRHILPLPFVTRRMVRSVSNN